MACAVVCVILGYLALSRNHGTFSNQFSTVLRTTQGLGLEKVMQERTDIGADPLPPHLASLELSVKPGSHERAVRRDGGWELVERR